MRLACALMSDPAPHRKDRLPGFQGQGRVHQIETEVDPIQDATPSGLDILASTCECLLECILQQDCHRPSSSEESPGKPEPHPSANDVKPSGRRPLKELRNVL